MKPHLQYPALIASLRQRGLSIGSERDAVATLKRIGYYRFSGYLYPLRAFGPSGRSDDFVTGAQFSERSIATISTSGCDRFSRRRSAWWKLR
jgi:abortive infection bacteriophage resistance protein